MVHWLSFGGGVNSTALAVLLCEGKLSQYAPWRIVFADTYDELEETYQFIDGHFRAYLRQHGKVLETVCPKEGVLERAERLSITISRILRSCTVEGKIKPIEKHLGAHGSPDDVQLIGIDAGESHRARNDPDDKLRRVYPLIEMGLDRQDCERIIQEAGLPVPPKSGCWHCPFKRVGEVLHIVMHEPCKAARIEALEKAATEKHGLPVRTQWGNKTVGEWRERANGGPLFALLEVDPPCACYDG